MENTLERRPMPFAGANFAPRAATTTSPDTPTPVIAATAPAPEASADAAPVDSPSTPRHLVFAQGQQPAAETPTVSNTKPATQSPAVTTEPASCSLPAGLSFKGEAHFPCDVRIFGEFDGKVTAEPDRTITLCEGGKASGDIKATNVRIEGCALGQITAAGGLASFGPKSVCTGQVNYSRLGIEEGAEVEASMKKVAA